MKILSRKQTVEDNLLNTNKLDVDKLKKLDKQSIKLYFLIWIMSGFSVVQFPKLTYYLVSVAYLALLLVLMIQKIDLDNSISRVGFIQRKLGAKQWFKGIFYGLIAVSFEALLIYLSNKYSSNSVSSENTEIILENIRKQPIYVLYIIGIAPIVEELIFRQSMFRLLLGFLKKLPLKLRYIFASVIVGLMFALVHADVTIVEYLIISMYLQFIYIKEGEIKISMVTHVTMNVLTLIILLM